MKKQHLFLAAFAIAVIAGLGSCSNDDELVAEQSKSIHVFTATMEGNPATRATFNSTGKYAEWEMNDEININGKSYKAKSAGAATSFVATDEDAEGETFTAYFPASLYNEGTPTLPSAISETYVAGRFNMPMYATSNNNELEFKNLCGVIAVTVNNDVIETVKKITVSSSDKAISGAFTVTENAAVLTEPSETANTLTVTYNESVTIDETDGNVFYIPVPAQTYTNLTIVLDADGTGTTTSCMIVKDGTATVERSKFYSVEFEVTVIGKGTAKATINSVETNVNWVQLWEGGPMFAEYNIGATSETGYGDYYTWGGCQNKVDDHNEGSAQLSGDSDTATKLWGSNWRMPTKAELSDAVGGLLHECTHIWTTNYKGSGVNGLLCTGKGVYSSNSVFFPAAGYYYFTDNQVHGKNTNGYCWSSMPNKSYACELTFSNMNTGIMSTEDPRTLGYSVRAVYDPATTGTAKATINSVETDVNWVQLWEGGPKFAEYNVGVTDGKAESFGGYYFWGGNIDQDPAQSPYWKSGSDALTGDDDTATKLWGSNWRMLTNDEFDNLLENCDVLWTTKNDVKGMLCTGKGKYSSNSIFLPAAGEYWTSVSEWGIGKYWTSTPSNGYQSYCWIFDEYSFKSVSGGDRFFAHSVRPVLVEQTE